MVTRAESGARTANGGAPSEIETLRLENEALRGQLDITKQTLDAMVRGELDSVVPGAAETPVLLRAAQKQLADLVTESRRTAEALAESEARYRDLVESSPEPILVHVDHRIAFANAATARVLGVACAEDLVGRSILDFAHEESRAEVEARLLLVIEGGLSAEASQQRYVRENDGQIVTIEVASIPIMRGGVRAMLSVARDVTARKQAEEDAARALTEANLERRKLETILEALPVGVWISDATGKLIQTNRAAATIWGGRAPLVAEQAQYREYKAFSPATGLPLRADEWALVRTLETGATIVAEPVDIERFDGTRGHALNSTAALKDADGRIVGGVVVMLDVTPEHESARERERLIASLEFERRRLGTLLQRAPSFMAATRGEQHVVELANDAYVDMVGAADVVGKPISHGFLGEGHRDLVEIASDVLATGTTFSAREMSVRVSRGRGSAPETRFVNLVCQPLVEADGTRTGVFVHGIDITDEANAQRRIRAQFNGIPEPTYAWQRATGGGTDLVLIDYNDAARALSRNNIDTIVGSYALDLYGSDSPIPKDLARCLETGERFDREIEHVLKTTGEAVHLHVTYAYAPPDIVLAHTADITERRKLEGQLRQAQKMEAVGRLAGGIAHDFNNMLSVIISYAEFLLKDLKPGDPMRADAMEIRDAGRRAVELTSQLLAFSRQQVLAPRSVDLDELLVGVEKMLRRLLGEDIELVLHPAATRPIIFADPSQIEQVVMNLAVNARDAMPRGGRLVLETATVRIDSDFAHAHLGMVPGPFVVLTVSDSGTGMDAPTISHIFEPFFTTKEKGTGLGLATVFGIVHQSGGRIDVTSAPGSGTTFTIYLPQAIETSPSGRPSHQPAVVGGNEAILLVEDDDAVRKVAKSILHRAGYDVFEAQNGGEALLICEEKTKIDLLITDVVMPRIGGRKLAERVLALRPSLKVLFISGYTDDAVVRHGVLGGDMVLLQKPITPDTLLRKVRELLDAPQLILT